MKGYTKEEKLEKRFQYSLTMAGILFAIWYLLYNFIVQQEFNIQQGIYTSNPDYIFILKVVSFLLIAVDAMLFTLGLIFVLVIALSGLYIANILIYKWQKRLYLFTNNIFKAGFIVFMFLIIYNLITLPILCLIMFLTSSYISLYTISVTGYQSMMFIVLIIPLIITKRFFKSIKMDTSILKKSFIIILILWFILNIIFGYHLLVT